MKSSKILASLLIVLLLPALVLAEPIEEKDKTGFFGTIILGGGMTWGKPGGLEVTDDNKNLATLDEKSDHQTRALGFVSGELGYGFASTGTKIYLSNQKSERSFADLVVEQPFAGIGTVRASFGYGSQEVWEDPYITGVDRGETDEDSLNFKLEWEQIAGSGFTATLKLSDLDVDHDLVGERYEDLKRDGELMAAEIGYIFTIGDNQMIIPGLDVEVQDRDGEANSCKKYGISVAHAIEFGKLSFLTSMTFGQRDFDKDHPVYHKTRDEKEYEISELITYAQPFGWKGFFLNGLVSYNRIDSNIEFFDQDELTIGAGIGYEF